MKFSRLIPLALSLIATAPLAAQEAPQTASEITREIASKIGKVSDFTATVESGEVVQGEPESVTASALEVSRLYGWKMTATGNSPYTIVTDFDTFYQYFPQENRVMKTTANNPMIKAMLVKPVSDMNPIALLDPSSVVYKGTEKFEASTVYHVEGTTESQLMPGGPLVKRTLSAWLSTEDGLPRKTVESVGISTGTTVYRNVKINTGLKPENFRFTPPAGAAVIDTNEQMKKIEQQMRGESPKTED